MRKERKQKGKPKAKRPQAISLSLGRDLEPVFYLDEVVMEGDAGFARVKKGLQNAGMLLVEAAPGVFKTPSVRASDGTPLRIVKECGYSPEGVVYILQDKEWMPVNRLPLRCVGRQARSSKVASHVSD